MDRLDAIGLGTEQHARQVHVVAADVVEGPAARIQDVTDVGRIVVVIRKPALDGGKGSDAARRDKRANRDPRRMEPVHERLHEVHAGPFRDLRHALRLDGGER